MGVYKLNFDRERMKLTLEFLDRYIYIVSSSSSENKKSLFNSSQVKSHSNVIGKTVIVHSQDQMN